MTRKRSVKSSEHALIECRERGWTADKVERTVFRFTTRDFLGFADVIALDGEDGSHAIQACKTDVMVHVRKFDADLDVTQAIALWLARGNRLSIWAFRKLKHKRGGKAFRWTLRELSASLVEGRVEWKEASRPRPNRNARAR